VVGARDPPQLLREGTGRLDRPTGVQGGQQAGHHLIEEDDDGAVSVVFIPIALGEATAHFQALLHLRQYNVEQHLQAGKSSRFTITAIVIDRHDRRYKKGAVEEEYLDDVDLARHARLVEQVECPFGGGWHGSAADARCCLDGQDEMGLERTT
jgi:hypothetical protein